MIFCFFHYKILLEERRITFFMRPTTSYVSLLSCHFEKVSPEYSRRSHLLCVASRVRGEMSAFDLILSLKYKVVHGVCSGQSEVQSCKSRGLKMGCLVHLVNIPKFPTVQDQVLFPCPAPRLVNRR